MICAPVMAGNVDQMLIQIGKAKGTDAINGFCDDPICDGSTAVEKNFQNDVILIHKCDPLFATGICDGTYHANVLIELYGLNDVVLFQNFISKLISLPSLPSSLTSLRQGLPSSLTSFCFSEVPPEASPSESPLRLKPHRRKP